MLGVIAVDQYGQTHHNLGKYPRKELLSRLGWKHASKMYVDTDEGVKHVGYIIGSLWFRLYSVEPWEKKACKGG